MQYQIQKARAARDVVPGCEQRRAEKLRARLLLFLAVVCLLPAGPLLRSQQPPPQPSQPPTITANVNVVNVLATVRNKHGEIIRNLTKDDFLMDEDGRPQTISYFAHETDLPLTLGLLVDTSMSQRRVLGQERDASYTFLDQMLRVNKDQAFVIHFDREVELLQDLTSSRQKLQAALALLETPQRPQEFDREGRGDPSADAPHQWPGQSGPGGREGQGREGRGGGMRGGGGTLLYDAVYLASNELMRPQQGRKALIVLSDGVDRGSKETLASAVEAAQRANTLVYSILFADEEANGNRGGMGGRGMGGMGRRGGMGRYPQESRPDGKKILEKISKETGGRLFEVSKKMSVDQIYASIQEELRNQYNLGYTPDRASVGPGYHKIHLVAKEKDLIVQARDGYYTDR
ncbi:MAG: VWA domain-containing protein [Terriglobia bacterium]|jgi:VWFA-related protein